MTKEKKVLVMKILIVLMILATIVVLSTRDRYSEPGRNAIIQKALEQKTAIQTLDQLVAELKNQKILVHPSFRMDKSDVVAFIKDLKSDNESQKIFHQFSQAGITIFLSDRDEIYEGDVFINIRKGVKKTAEWLKKGK